MGPTLNPIESLVALASLGFLIWLSCMPLFIYVELRKTNRLLREIRDSGQEVVENTKPASKRSASSAVKYSAGND